MTRQLAQLGAIVIYESLMHWRRRVVTFLMLLFIIGLVGFSIFTEHETSKPRVQMSYRSVGDTVEVTETPLPPIETMEDFASLYPGDAPPWIHTVSYEQFSNDQVLIILLGVSLLPLFIGIPPLFADSIPLDRQSKVRELLETLPLGKTTYLAGKVLGLWLSLILGLLVCAVLYGVVVQFLFGVYDLLLYVALWGLVIIPSVMVVSAFTVLLASGVGSRRIAVLIGAGIVPLSLIFAMAVVTMMSVSGVGLSGATPLAQFATYSEVVGSMLTNAVRVILMGALALPVAWTLAWLWTKWGDSRRPAAKFMSAVHSH